MAGEFKGTTVTATGPFVDQDAQKFNATMADFQAKTGITVAYQGSKEFEASIKAAIEGGSAPDVIDFPQPGLLASFAKEGKITDLSKYPGCGRDQSQLQPLLDRSIHDARTRWQLPSWPAFGNA